MNAIQALSQLSYTPRCEEAKYEVLTCGIAIQRDISYHSLTRKSSAFFVFFASSLIFSALDIVCFTHDSTCRKSSINEVACASRSEKRKAAGSHWEPKSFGGAECLWEAKAASEEASCALVWGFLSRGSERTFFGNHFVRFAEINSLFQQTEAATVNETVAALCGLILKSADFTRASQAR